MNPQRQQILRIQKGLGAESISDLENKSLN